MAPLDQEDHGRVTRAYNLQEQEDLSLEPHTTFGTLRPEGRPSKVYAKFLQYLKRILETVSRFNRGKLPHAASSRRCLPSPPTLPLPAHQRTAAVRWQIILKR